MTHQLGLPSVKARDGGGITLRRGTTKLELDVPATLELRRWLEHYNQPSATMVVRLTLGEQCVTTFLQSACRVSAGFTQRFGEEWERRVVIEELAELLGTYTHHLRGRARTADVAEEAADTILAAVHAAHLTGAGVDDLVNALEAKLERSQELLEEVVN